MDWLVDWDNKPPAIELRVGQDGIFEVATDLEDAAVIVALARVLNRLISNGDFSYASETTGEQLELPDTVPGSEEDLIWKEQHGTYGQPVPEVPDGAERD